MANPNWDKGTETLMTLVDVGGPGMLPHAFLHLTHGGGDLKVKVGAGLLRAQEVNAWGATGSLQSP